MITEILLAAIFLLAAINIFLSAGSGSARHSNRLNSLMTKMDADIARLDGLIRDELSRVRDASADSMNGLREQIERSAKENRAEQANSLRLQSEALTNIIGALARMQVGKLDGFSAQLSDLMNRFDDRTGNLREQLERSAKDNRAEQSGSLKSFEEKFEQNVRDFNELQRQKFDDLLSKNEQMRGAAEEKLREIRETVENKLRHMQDENGLKLEEMRRVVDEKLQATVERRFNESFKMISSQLEQVHKGLGEMQTLASGVGDLKKVLTNVKTRGTLGEIQLGAILEQILSREQYERNAVIKHGSLERVEYAVKLPGRDDGDKSLLLPIDSKFPTEDYQRLLDAYDNIAAMNPKDVESLSKQFENSVRKNARDIRDKYIDPPATTDFAIMFVPSEGLYAEILRRAGLFEALQRDFKVTVVGPANLSAFLSSLHMGFRTLAIERRSSEVWEILGAVKTHFGAFGEALDRTKKKLQEAANAIDKAGAKSRAIERKLRNVQELPRGETEELFGVEEEADAVEDDGILE
jgi:DNA recombination protein RmuC